MIRIRIRFTEYKELTRIVNSFERILTKIAKIDTLEYMNDKFTSLHDIWIESEANMIEMYKRF